MGESQGNSPRSEVLWNFLMICKLYSGWPEATSWASMVKSVSESITTVGMLYRLFCSYIVS